MEFERLVKKLTPTLKRITYRLNGHFAYFNEEDLFQEALIRLWQDFNKGRLVDKTDSYILQGCYFHLKNYIHKHREKAVKISLEAAAFDEEDGLTTQELLLAKYNTESHFNYLNEKLLAEAIRNNGLTAKEKLILSFCADCLTTREIGSRLGVSHVSVVKSMAIIRRKCKKYLD